MREVAIVGAAMTKFGELWDRSLRDIGLESGMLVLMDAGMETEDVEALFLGNMSAGRFIQQEHIGALIADHAGLADRGIPATRVEAGGATGSLALRQAYLTVASGAHDVVMVGGAEKMTDVSDRDAEETMSFAADQEWEVFFGATLASLYAMMARRHMHDHGTTPEQLAHVAVKNHAHGSGNPKAQFRNKLTVERVLGAGRVAEPLGVLDCSPISDGGAAVVLTTLERAKEITDEPVIIRGSAQASDTLALHDRWSITSQRATRLAVQGALSQAGKELADIDLMEVNDGFTIAEIIALEDLGLAEPGKGGRLAEEGVTALGGDMPVNTSGGLKARGNPPGATGIAQIVEIYDQLKGRAEGRQVADARVGLAHNVGGTGATVAVHILEVA
ncbi:MAG: thiolase domain-containing protein [Thermoplasmata archaeon]|nr:thiolase domain-containing protein [Thermoplasmata archaeon]